ncbi:SMAD/FHA domain-containing protein [Xylaria sp. CBS 124048]|nr:SMAD/FHA domain-containing protein [Xylaria sp. CBS 124048]
MLRDDRAERNLNKSVTFRNNRPPQKKSPCNHAPIPRFINRHYPSDQAIRTKRAMGSDTSHSKNPRGSRDSFNDHHAPSSRNRPGHRDDSDREEGSRRHRDRDRDGSRDRHAESRRHRRARSPSDAQRDRSRSRRDRRPANEREHRSRDYEKYDKDRERRHRTRRDDGDNADNDNDDGEKSGGNHNHNHSSNKQVVRRGGPLPSQADSFALTNGEEPSKPKEKPNYGNSGALAAASNSVTQADGSTVVLKYHEPPEARKPSPRDQWRLFVFKGEEIIDTVPLSNRSCWLIGRDVAVVDMAAEHPSVSKQHAVIQFRYIEKRNEYGDKMGKVKPYLIDLESANGTSLNSKKAPQSRYLELRDKDMIQFGQSTREYVLMLAPKD